MIHLKVNIKDIQIQKRTAFIVKEKEGTPVLRCPERCFNPCSTFLSDSLSLGLCLLIIIRNLNQHLLSTTFHSFNLISFQNCNYLFD